MAFVLPFLGGIFFAASFPIKNFPSLPLAGILGIAAWLTFTRWMRPALSWRSTFLALLAFSFGLNLLGFYWIPETLREFGQIPFPVNYLIGALFSLVVVPHLLVAMVGHYCWQRWQKNLPPWFPRPKLGAFTHSRHILLAGLLCGLEEVVPQQFPAHLGHSWLHFAPALGLAPICGATGMSLISFYVAVALADPSSYRRPWQFFSLPLGSLVLMIVLNFLLPLPSTAQREVAPSRSLHLRMVQANIGNFDKVSSRQGAELSLKKIYQRYFSLSTAPSTLAGPLDLIIWPETAYPHLLFSLALQAQTTPIPELLGSIATATGSDLLIGGYDLAPTTPKDTTYFENQYNTAFHWDSQGTLLNVYHKIKLIPFGEGLPFGPLNRFFSNYLQNISYFAPGNNYPLFRHSHKNVTFIVSICYEILFADLLRSYLQRLPQRPDFIINLTNDSWYGDTSEPYQHLFLSKWRALEFQLPIARMTNTGITALIYPDGSESRGPPLFVADFLDVSLLLGPKSLGATIYQRWGNWVNGGIFLLLLLFAVLADAGIFFQNRFVVGKNNRGK